MSGEPISRADFDHWLRVVHQSQASGGERSPEPPPPGTSQYKQLSTQVMQFLVSARWIAGEAAERDITASEEEVRKSFERTKQDSFSTEKAYKRFLKSSGQSQEDIDFRVRSDVLASKLRDDVLKGAKNDQRALDVFTREFRKKWRERTRCLRGFVIPDCANSRVPQKRQPAPGLPFRERRR